MAIGNIPPQKFISSPVNFNSIINPKMFLKQWFLATSSFATSLLPPHTHTHLETFLIVLTERKSLLLASSGWGGVAEMLLNVVWCMGQPPATPGRLRMIQLEMPIVPGLKKSPWRKEFPDLWILFTSSEKPASDKTKGRGDFFLLTQTGLQRPPLPGIPDKTPTLGRNFQRPQFSCTWWNSTRMLVSSFSFTFHDASNYLVDGDENELKSLSRAIWKTISRWEG